MSAAGNQPLSAAQKTRLVMLAREAFALCKARGAVDEDADFDAWRYAEHGEACERPPFGLREAMNDDFRRIRGRFAVILGNAELAFADFVEGAPDAEERRRMAYRLAGHVGALVEFWAREKGVTDAEAARQAWAYTAAIARDKARGRKLADLSAKELAELGYTILNRTNAFRGVGNPAFRNKRQGGCKV